MEEDIISSYTSIQAEEDGLLINLIKINPKWEKGLFNYVTRNLMQKGYIDNLGKIKEKPNIPNILDLLTQAFQIVKKKSKNFTEPDYFFSGNIELPNGQKQEIFIVHNEKGKFTLMLPEDY